MVFEFWGDNLDELKHVRDLRSDHQGEMLHMFSLIAGRSRTPAPELLFVGQIAQLNSVFPAESRPSVSVVAKLLSSSLLAP